MGPLGLRMAGMICLAPVITNGLSPIMGLIFEAAGSDPARFASLYLLIWTALI